MNSNRASHHGSLKFRSGFGHGRMATCFVRLPTGAVLDVDHAEQIDMTHTSHSRTSTRYHIFADPHVLPGLESDLTFVSRHALSRGTRTRPDVVTFLCNVMRLAMSNEV